MRSLECNLGSASTVCPSQSYSKESSTMLFRRFQVSSMGRRRRWAPVVYFSWMHHMGCTGVTNLSCHGQYRKRPALKTGATISGNKVCRISKPVSKLSLIVSHSGSTANPLVCRFPALGHQICQHRKSLLFRRTYGIL